MRGRPVPLWVLVSAAWIGPATLAVFRAYLHGPLGDGQPVQWRGLVFEGGDWLLYGFLTPAVWWFARRYPLTRGTIARPIGAHLAAAVVLCAAWAGGGILLSYTLFGSTPYDEGVIGWFFTSLPFGVAVYFAVLAVEHAVFYAFEAREREAQAAALSAQLADARLGALQMQMQPHFLLNSLNAITVIVRDQDTATATRMLEMLGEMLQRIVRTDRPSETALAEELAFVQSYLAIEEIRFPDRLRIVFDADAAVLDAAVPEFLLQPLVENALRHGVARRAGVTTVRIEATQDRGDLVLSVTDDGPDPEAGPATPGKGLGLSNTRERLATRYGNRASLRLEPTPEHGTLAEIRLPYTPLGPHDG